MPTYVFSENGEEFEVDLRISELDAFRADHPQYTLVPQRSNIVSGVGSAVKPDGGFKEVLSKIAENNPNSAMAKEHGNKSARDVKVRQAVEKWRNRVT